MGATTRCGFSLIKLTEMYAESTSPLTRSLFGDGIPRSLLLRVSPAKPTFAPLRFSSLRKMKPRFVPRHHVHLQETRREADAVRQNIPALQFFGPLPLPPLLPQEPRKYDSQGARFQPLVRANMAYPESSWCPIVSDSVVYRSDALVCVTRGTARPTAGNGSASQPKRKILTR